MDPKPTRRRIPIAFLFLISCVLYTSAALANTDLSLTKTDSPDPVTVGQNLTYLITVHNNGPYNSGATVTDTLPAGVTLVSKTPSQGSCSGTTTVTCNLGTVTLSVNATVTIIVTVTPTAVSPLSNTASVTTAIGDTVPGNNSATASTTINAASADLSITKVDSPDPVGVGLNVTYLITVTNLGPGTATAVQVTDTLPAGVNYVSATPSVGSCSGTTTVTCNLGSLAFPGSATVTIVGQTTVAGMISNTASVTSTTTDPTPGNDSATATTNVGDVSRLINISTRAFVGTNVDVLVGGFILGGNLPKQVLIRGFGPTLSSFGVTGVLANPTLELSWDDDSNPLTAPILLATNNDFETLVTTCNAPAVCGTPTQIIATGMSANSYAPSNPNRSLDAALLVTLPPGSYTVNLAGVSSGTGVGLIGVDDTDGSTQPKLVNISTRGQVLTLDHIMIGGFIIGAGTGNKQVLVRGFGPTLSDFGVTGALANPTLELFWDDDSNPLTAPILLATNNDFETLVTTCNAPAVCGTPTQIIATGMSANTYAPSNPNRNLDAALLVTLPPGAYTVNLLGVSGGTGVGLVGIDELGN